MENFKTYLVGGAVRDQLMGREPKDKDYVVVGATPADMLAAGYQQVGADFPVFLHPETKDEYALARTERKSGNGYNGFTCVTEGLNPELLKKFNDAGFESDKEYSMDVLMEVFQRTGR